MKLCSFMLFFSDFRDISGSDWLSLEELERQVVESINKYEVCIPIFNVIYF